MAKWHDGLMRAWNKSDELLKKRTRENALLEAANHIRENWGRRCDDTGEIADEIEALQETSDAAQ